MMADLSPKSAPAWGRGGVYGAAALFALFFLLAHLLRADLDPAWVPISEYALGGRGLAMILAFVSLAVACAALFVTWRGRLRGWQGVVAQIGLLLAMVGFLLGAAFPTDSVLDSPQRATTIGMVHSLGAVLVDGLPLASLFGAWSITRFKGPGRRFVAWLGTLLAWSGFIALVVAMAIYLPATNGELGPDAPVGWAGRYTMVAYAGWLVLMAWLTRPRSSD